MIYKTNSLTSLEYESAHWKDKKIVIGIDEVGRGSLIGPLYAGAVAFAVRDRSAFLAKPNTVVINDSKKLTSKMRDKTCEWIISSGIIHTHARVEVKYIDRLGIQQAGKRVMRKVFQAILGLMPPNVSYHVLTDYYPIACLDSKKQTCIAHGDELSVAIALASIVAKVNRDRFMRELAVKYPHYGLERNAGYGTYEHRKAIIRYGFTSQHRRTFKVRDI